MSMRSVVWLWCLGACAPHGVVSWTDGPDTFDDVGRALWFDVTQTTGGEGAERNHAFWLTDGGGTCGDWRQAFELGAEVVDSLFRAKKFFSGDGQGEEECEQLGALLGRWTNVGARVDYTRVLQISVDARGVGDAEAPAAGTYQNRVEDADAANTFHATLEVDSDVFPDSNPLEGVDCAADDWHEALRPLLKGTEPKKGQSRFYSTATGTLEVAAAGDDAYELELVAAQLNDQDGKPAGRIDASGRFEHCTAAIDFSK